MVLKAPDSDIRNLALCHGEFRRPLSDGIRKKTIPYFLRDLLNQQALPRVQSRSSVSDSGKNQSQRQQSHQHSFNDDRE
ncbi:hypothetical protein TNCV_3717301 [Trichonephila clavipes]|nr:hypothetical protein TNCV_3717301 [Trichonephila clavipes]